MERVVIYSWDSTNDETTDNQALTNEPDRYVRPDHKFPQQVSMSLHR